MYELFVRTLSQGLQAFMPVAVFLACWVGGRNSIYSPAKVPAIGIFALAGVMVLVLAWRMFRHPSSPLPPLIGAHIRLVLVLQAAVCYFAAPWDLGPICAGILLLLWPVSRVVSRRFYAS